MMRKVGGRGSVEILGCDEEDVEGSEQFSSLVLFPESHVTCFHYSLSPPRLQLDRETGEPNCKA